MKDVIVGYPTYLPGDFEGLYVERRNTAVAERLASIIGGQVCNSQASIGERYHVPHAALTKDVSEQMGIATHDDLFGGVVEVRPHRDKAILHPKVHDSDQKSNWHSSQFARLVSSAVLPGFSTFSISDAERAFHELAGQGYGVRCKDPTRDGSGGQWEIRDSNHLGEILRWLPAGQIREHGIVLEPNLIDPQTFSVGQIYLNGNFYSYFGQQETTTSPKGNPTYGGTTLTMVRGDFSKLSQIVPSPELRLAVQQACTVYDAYSIYNPIVSRANFDVIQGQTANGENLSGVVDQSLRIGGASPAEVMAIEALNTHTDATQVTARVTIRWNPEQNPVAPGEVLFFDHPRKRDLASIVEIR